jgi:hypothetical protein
MTDSQAEKWVVSSALVVAGIYAYRRLTEKPTSPPVTAKQIAGVGQLPPLGPWTTAWGFTFLVVALVATAAPELGAAFAVLIAVGDLMTNAQSIMADVGVQEGAKASSSSPAYPAGTATAAAIAATGHDPSLSQAGVTPGIFNTPSGPATYKPPPGIKVVG